MTVIKRILIILFAVVAFDGFDAIAAQSLAEAAQREAERRKLLEEQGVEEKVIQQDTVLSASEGNVTTSKMPAVSEAPPAAFHRKGSVQVFRKKLQKYDRDIQQAENRIESLRRRAHSERWALPKTGRITKPSSSSDMQENLKTQIEELENKLKLLREERAETYEEGKKAGFLPGELEGKGIIP